MCHPNNFMMIGPLLWWWDFSICVSSPRNGLNRWLLWSPGITGQIALLPPPESITMREGFHIPPGDSFGSQPLSAISFNHLLPQWCQGLDLPWISLPLKSCSPMWRRPSESEACYHSGSLPFHSGGTGFTHSSQQKQKPKPKPKPKNRKQKTKKPNNTSVKIRKNSVTSCSPRGLLIMDYMRMNSSLSKNDHTNLYTDENQCHAL